ncbi:hypothetical protein [Polaribacter sp.]|uniref:hypothetical protein n=1 Tax=Polaribacter sp. TaxID=1920175 RepID=UPI0040489D86
MKKLICIIVLISNTVLFAQKKDSKNNTNFELGKGLTFNLNEGNYQFYLGGFIQPSISFEKTQGNNTEYLFNSKRSFFMLGGNLVNEKISFLVQTDFSLASPLMDAWVAYHPTSWLTISAGQKQTFVNNREMMIREDRLQFTERGMLSQTFSNTGREFGLFFESKFGTKFGFAPKFAITSGDGRNSFGTDSRDTDLGGLKVGGRLDLYPLGFFSEGNDLLTADLAREQSPKILFGGAISKNNGASNAVGEGHGDFMLYNASGKTNLPDYTQVYIDLLFKYKGFSFLGEYANATVNGLNINYLDDAASQILAPQQISEFLVLGDSYNLQFGYVTEKGFSFDMRYESNSPEFATNLNSFLTDASSYTFGLSKYLNNNKLKIQATITSVNNQNGNNQTFGELMMQIAF